MRGIMNCGTGGTSGSASRTGKDVGRVGKDVGRVGKDVGRVGQVRRVGVVKGNRFLEWGYDFFLFFLFKK